MSESENNTEQNSTSTSKIWATKSKINVWVLQAMFGFVLLYIGAITLLASILDRVEVWQLSWPVILTLMGLVILIVRSEKFWKATGGIIIVLGLGMFVFNTILATFNMSINNQLMGWLVWSPIILIVVGGVFVLWMFSGVAVSWFRR